MRSLHSLAYQISRLSANAVKTGAHRFHTDVFGIANRKTTSVPTKFFVSDPPLFPGGWSYPYSAFSMSVHNGQTPFSFQFQDIAVRNQVGSKRINNLNYIFFQHHFWFNPNQVNNHSQCRANHQLKRNLRKTICNPKTIYNKQKDQYERATSPYVITSRPKSLIHVSSIAGEIQ